MKRTLKRELEQLSFRAAFCMYCYESRGTDIDHFEPIKEAPLRTFDWSNHVLACGYCNQQAKLEQFPRDAQGGPLLIDPFQEDPALHLTLVPSGFYVALSARGTAMIETLGLNRRKELVEARAVSWFTVVDTFQRAAREGRQLSVRDIRNLKSLPTVDAFHHFMHDVSAKRRTLLAIGRTTIQSAERQLANLSTLFPSCAL
ncbi:HNH endonuclease [Amnibacterium kyonggiense]